MMQVQQVLVCNHCTLGCHHCPYAVEYGEDYYPNENIGDANDKISILTGGEPLESPALSSWIRHISVHRSFFRIATGGFVPLGPWQKRLSVNPGFLGFNMGTDIFSSRARPSTNLVNIWLSNWKMLSTFSSTWLTLTIGNELNLAKAIQIIGSMSPRIVLVNSLEESTSFYIRNLMTTFSGVYFIDGYSPKN